MSQSGLSPTWDATGLLGLSCTFLRFPQAVETRRSAAQHAHLSVFPWEMHFVVQSLSHVWLFATPWTIACPVDYSMPGFLVLHSLPEFAQTHVVESVMPSNHVTFCHPLLLLPSVFPSIRVFSSEYALCIKWPKYWSFSFSISPSNEMCLFNLLCGQREKGEGFSAQFPSWAGFLSVG